jgi:RHS repeat-associated protein
MAPLRRQVTGYDALDRLSGWATASTTQAFAYDATGNRTSLTVGADSYAYAVDASSNRLLSTAGPGGAKTFTHDAMGNIVAAGTTSFAYDARGRMRSATGVLGTTTYSLNALGERVSKTTGTDGRHFHYDRAGRLIAETDASGNALKEYVWLADQPIAVFDTTRSSGGACTPENPTPVNPAAFTAFNALERLEVRGGRPGSRDWEWGLGPNTQAAGQFASAYLDWVSGRQYTYVLAYDGAGNATVTVSFEGAVLFTRNWPGGMDAGNALKFYVKASSDVGAGNGVAVSIGTINGRPVNRTIQASGSNQFVEEVAVYQTASGAFTVEGTVAMTFSGTAPPAGSRVNFMVTAGNVPCEGTEASTTLYYVHADHLNTPRALVDQQNRVVWRWDSDPFGVAAASEDPDGDGKNVTFDLRFAGQYFDRETNLHYNYFRDYDPQTGRYVQADPIGIAWDKNLFAYVKNAPLTASDSLGLGPTDKTYGLPKDFWNWFHRQYKKPGDPDIGKNAAMELYEE